MSITDDLNRTEAVVYLTVKMLKTLICLLGFYLTTTIAPGAHRNNFHQNDYKMKFEWAETSRVNKKFGDYKGIVFKYNRTTTAMNFTLFINMDLGYDVEVVLQMYKFASNEYRLFPLRFQLNFCEAVKRDILGTTKLAETGNLSCPLLKGKQYTTLNWTPDAANLPPFIPSGRYMVELQYLYHSREIMVTKNYVNIYRPFTEYED